MKTYTCSNSAGDSAVCASSRMTFEVVMRSALAIGLISLCCSAHAQEGDNCKDVLSARSYSTETANIGLAVKIYEQNCQGSQSKKSSSLSVGLDTVIQSVPLKFNLGSGSGSERLSHFCKTFDSAYQGNESYFKNASDVAGDAASSWLSCMSFAAKGISFKPSIASTQLVVDIARTNATPASVEGITYDEKLLSCTAPNTNATPGRTKVDESSVKDLTESYWTVTCRRIPQVQGDDSVYPKADISIGTTKGAFIMPIPPDASHPYQWSSEMQAKIRLLEERLAESNNRMNARIDGIKLTETKREQLKEFACGGNAIATEPLQFMVGSKDGTGCKVMNVNYVKTIGLEIPPKE